MNGISIQVEGVGKRFRIKRATQASYKTLRDQIANIFTEPFRSLKSRNQDTASHGEEYIWALKDVSLTVNHGEVIGIIGTNGAGKSTLLKILTRITEPTEGDVHLYGRVGALLEVGTGFHRELSGRENVYFNGAILGMRKTEIDRKFDDIVAFAEVEKFIDTPMKFYSSGMQVRLAFSIAAHLEPEILLVDEVLAVGDVAFQRKCISKMENVGKEGRTVLFVSHHMPSIVRLCERVILLNEGKIECEGPAQEVVSEYLQAGLDATSSRVWHDVSKAPGSDIVRLRSIRIKTEANRSPIEISEDIGIEMEYDVLESGYVLFPHFIVRNEQGIKLFVSFDTNSTWFQNSRPKGTYVSTGWIPGNLLAEGTMIIGPAMTTYDPYEVHFYKPEAVAFQVVENPDDGNLRIDAPGIMPGVMRPLLKWETKFYPEGRKS